MAMVPQDSTKTAIANRAKQTRKSASQETTKWICPNRSTALCFHQAMPRMSKVHKANLTRQWTATTGVQSRVRILLKWWAQQYRSKFLKQRAHQVSDAWCRLIKTKGTSFPFLTSQSLVTSLWWLKASPSTATKSSLLLVQPTLRPRSHMTSQKKSNELPPTTTYPTTSSWCSCATFTPTLSRSIRDTSTSCFP